VWATEFNLDFAAILLAAAVLLIVAIVVVRLAIRRRARPLETDRVTSARLDEFALAHLVEDSRRFLNLWQERVERLGELHSRLTTMTQEIDQLRAQVTQLDELRGENLRLGEEVGALVLERDDLRLVLGRIGELLQRASVGP
jgi:DNA repair ATPase RecN